MSEPDPDTGDPVGTDPFHAAAETTVSVDGDTAVQHNVSTRSFARNVAFSYLATFASLLAGVVVTPVLFRQLGSEAFGVYSLVIGIAGFALLADLGIGTTTIRRVAAAVATHDDDALSEAVAASRRLMRWSGALSLAALAAVAWQLPTLFGLPHGLAGRAQLALLGLAVGQTFLVGTSTSTSVIIGHGRSDLYAKRSLALGVGTAAAQCVVALVGGGVVGVCLAVAASFVASAVIGLRLQRSVLGDTAIRTQADGRAVRDVVREGSANFVIAVCGAVAFTSDTIVLGALAPFAAVAAYSVAAKLPTLIRTLSSRWIDLLTPTYSHLHAAAPDAGPAAMFTVLGRTTKFSLAVAVASGLATCTSLRLILDTWIGYTPHGAPAVAYLLTAATALQMSGHAIFILLTGVRRLRPLLFFSIGSATVNIVLSVVLTPHLHAAGPAVGTLVCVGVGDVIVLPVLAAGTLGRPAWTVIRELTLVAVAPAIPAVGLALALHVPTGSGWAPAVSAAVFIVYLAGFWTLVGSADRTWARRMARRVTARTA